MEEEPRTGTGLLAIFGEDLSQIQIIHGTCLMTAKQWVGLTDSIGIASSDCTFDGHDEKETTQIIIT